MHDEFDRLTAQAEAAFQTAINAAAAHRADLSLKPIGDHAQLEAKLFDELNEALMVDITALAGPYAATSTPPTPAPAPSATSSTKTRRISLRVPGSVLVKYKDRARLTGTKYQSLVIKTLRTAAAGW